MVMVIGVDLQRYPLVFEPGGRFPAVRCPGEQCESKLLSGHGWHWRYIDGQLFPFRRGRCRCCGVSHVVLPEDVVAYWDAQLVQLEVLLSTPGGPTERARALGEAAVPSAVRRVRRMLQALRQQWVEHLQALLPPAEGDLWSRAVAAMGAAPGTLVRLRRFLWTRYGLLLSGLSGLFRRGRPPRFVREASPEFGSSAGR